MRVVCGLLCVVVCLRVCVCLCVFACALCAVFVFYCVMFYGVAACFVFVCMPVFTVFVCKFCNVWRGVLLLVFCSAFHVCVCVRCCYCLTCLGDVAVIYCVKPYGLLCALGICVCLCVVLWFRKVVVC